MRNSPARRGAANMTPVLMILAFAAIVGFLVWLGATAEPTEPVVVEEEEPEETMDSLEMAATEVSPSVLRQSPGDVEGELVRIQAPVAQNLGPIAFFLELENPFPVAFSQELREAGAETPPGGASVVVTGTVRAFNDSILNDWGEEGLVSSSDLTLMEFGSTHFIDALRLRNARPGSGGGGAGGGAAAEPADTAGGG